MKPKNDMKNSYPGSEKIYVPGKLYNIQVGMRKVNLTDTVKFIADNAFKESYSLEDIYLTKNVPYKGKSAFKDSKDLTIHAPTDSYAHTFATENKINFKATDD